MEHTGDCPFNGVLSEDCSIRMTCLDFALRMNHYEKSADDMLEVASKFYKFIKGSADE